MGAKVGSLISHRLIVPFCQGEGAGGYVCSPKLQQAMAVLGGQGTSQETAGVCHGER